ncbi:MAG: pantoate--beta-alanine ligase [Alphaproteobacteria bacterium]
MSLVIVRHLSDFRQRRTPGQSLALVPTMGALHEGHLSLIEEAKKNADAVIVSIFVNPTQFAAHEDFGTYPRTFDQDIEKLKSLQVDYLYAPDVTDLYPQGPRTMVEPGPIGTILEGAHRPGFFRGVATVVNKLIGGISPDVAIFGEKDFQQYRVICEMVEDCRLPCQILACPTVRDKDGLALSSRNAYLSIDERKKAVGMHQMLQDLSLEILRHNLSPEAIQERGTVMLQNSGFDQIDYVYAGRFQDLSPAFPAQTGDRLLAAAYMGTTRLIDNISL